MPHKHKRKAGDDPDQDLPPTSIAQALPVGKKQAKDKSNVTRKKQKRNPGSSTSYGFDDTPAAFKRLQAMQQGGPRPNSLDDGKRVRGKRKQTSKISDQAAVPTATNKTSSAPRIMPGEKLADFAARVDHAIPIAGVSKKNKSLAEFGIHDKQTRLEKKIQRKIAGWREAEARRKDSEQEKLDEIEEDEAENWTSQDRDPLVDGSKGKKRKGQVDDPWAELNRTRGQRAALNDVVQAPPQFDKIPVEKLKMKGGAGVSVANVPRTAGSLAKREELNSARRSIIEGYRRMMESQRSGSNG